MTTYISYLESPVGRLVMASDGTALTALQPADSKYPIPTSADWVEDDDAPPFPETQRQLHDYFSGRRTRFDLPLSPSGTPFQQSVWRELLNIEYGATASYGDIARRIGNVNAM